MMRMTATHAYVVTSSLYVHNLLNQVRDDDSIMNDAAWLPKANDYELDSKKLHDDWTLMDSRCKYIQECQGYRGRQSCFRCQHCHCRQEESHALFFNGVQP